MVVHVLDELIAGKLAGLPRYGGDAPALVLGELILEAFLGLQAEHEFALVHFPDCAPAMGLIEAKRLGVFAVPPAIAVELGQPSFWLTARDLRPRTGARDLKLDHCERHAFAHADLRVARDPEVLASARALEWPLGDVLTEDLDAKRWLALAGRPGAAGGLPGHARH